MEKKEVLTGFKAEKFLEKFVPVSESQLVQEFKELKIKAPLVLKIISPDALHKTDIGGVKIVRNQKNVERAFLELANLAHKKRLRLEGIMAQKYYEGEQIIIGIKKDPVFNHIILFGMGGIFTEVFQDTSVRKCPISMHDAEEMINELRASKIFKGFRGKKLNTKTLKTALIKISKIPIKYPSIKEMDINPYILNDKKGTVVDSRIVFE